MWMNDRQGGFFWMWHALESGLRLLPEDRLGVVNQVIFGMCCVFQPQMFALRNVPTKPLGAAL